MKRDELYRSPLSEVEDFVFNEKVADVFEDMARRSIPGYQTIINLIGVIVASHLKEQGIVNDLGCSLGALSRQILNSIPKEASVEIIGIDNSPAMIARARQSLDDPRATFFCQDILSYPITGSVVVLNFTLQFIPKTLRDGLIARIWQEMPENGLMILSEKISDDRGNLNEFFNAIHLNWKNERGYSELEISQKRQALENVMILESEADHKNRLSKAGFTRVNSWFRCLNWVSFLAHK